MKLEMEDLELPPGKIILFAGGNLLRIADQIEEALVAGDKELFQKKGAIQWKSPNGIVKANATLLRVRAMRVVEFVQYKAGTRPFLGRYYPVEVDPPIKYFTALLAKGVWAFPELDEPLAPSK
jgi:hypothetical protein